MLKTPSHIGKQRPHSDIDLITKMIAKMNGNRTDTEIKGEGLLEIGHFSGDHIVYTHNVDLDMKYPSFINGSDDYLGSYGVCDSIEQFVKYCGKRLQDDERTFCVTFTHVKKEPSNAGEGGGWRWHKWGAYIGEGNPTCEYLDDEEYFDNGVYVYSIYQTDGPIIKPQWN